MSGNLLNRAAHSLAHASQHARHHGEKEKANGMLLTALGLTLMPFPILGVPLVAFGAKKILTGKKTETEGEVTPH